MQARRVRRDPDVGRHRQRQAGAHRHPVDAGDDRLVGVEPEGEGEASDPALLVEDLLLVRQPGLRWRAVASAEVEAGAEGVAVAGEAAESVPTLDAVIHERARLAIVTALATGDARTHTELRDLLERWQDFGICYRLCRRILADAEKLERVRAIIKNMRGDGTIFRAQTNAVTVSGGTFVPANAATPTATPSPSPTPTSTPAASPSPTIEPSPTETPTELPTETPTPEPTVEPTLEPTVTPTEIPSETPTPTEASEGTAVP